MLERKQNLTCSLSVTHMSAVSACLWELHITYNSTVRLDISSIAVSSAAGSNGRNPICDSSSNELDPISGSPDAAIPASAGVYFPRIYIACPFFAILARVICLP